MPHDTEQFLGIARIIGIYRLRWLRALGSRIGCGLILRRVNHLKRQFRLFLAVVFLIQKHRRAEHVL